MAKLDLSIPSLGEPGTVSPLKLSTVHGDGIADFTADDDRVIFDPRGHDQETFFEAAGPRTRTYFGGDQVAAGIVTCGGCAPG